MPSKEAGTPRVAEPAGRPLASASAADVAADVAIIGAGPVGLFAVFECGMLGLSTVVVDALEAAGGQCTALYPEKPIYDIPAHPRIDAGELVTKLEAQAAPFAPRYLLGQRVERLARKGEDWRLHTDKGASLRARAVFIAAGAGAFGPNRPPLAHLADYEGKSVFYLVKRREDFRGKRVVIAGGGDSAVDWALSLAEVAAKVAIVHRRDKFRAAPESVARLKRLVAEGRIELVVPYQLAALVGHGGRLAAVTVEDLDGRRRDVEADVLLPFFGLAASLGPIAQWDLALERHHIAVDPASGETSQPGIYAIGDVAAYPGKLKLILTGFAEAARAAHSAFARCRPGEALHWEYSTTKGLPGA
ncbi:MAG: NAD(P)/FAD-dependent oxidoreductase [Rhodospirillaceae bacterium]|nr:NAD(P)/FAD-dependent oxidoreductase [Rhodospirillaceae bacterium]